MNKTERNRCLDFISIALEEIDANNYDVAYEFLDDVRVELLNANEEELSQALQHSLNKFDEDEYSEGRSVANGVYMELDTNE